MLDIGLCNFDFPYITRLTALVSQIMKEVIIFGLGNGLLDRKVLAHRYYLMGYNHYLQEVIVNQ